VMGNRIVWHKQEYCNELFRRWIYGYYVGQSSYEILSITDNHMAVRFVANNTGLAWYMILPQQNQRR
jgi:hypothetical protein